MTAGSIFRVGGCVLALAMAMTFQAVRAEATERAFSTRVVESGHSLTDPIPPMLSRMVVAAGGKPSIARSTIPGSPMDWRRNNPTDPLPNAWTDIQDYELLVLTERVSLSTTVQWHDSENEALRWVENAWTKGNGGKGAETMLYASWIHITSGPNFDNFNKDPEGHVPFRLRLPMEWERWEKIAAHVNANRPEGMPPVRMIPGPLLFAALYDAVEAKQAPDLEKMEMLFTDAIHINDIGAYFISLAHYAMIYGGDPRGLPADVGQDQPLTPALAAFMQELVWKVLNDYEGSGLAPA